MFVSPENLIVSCDDGSFRYVYSSSMVRRLANSICSLAVRTCVLSVVVNVVVVVVVGKNGRWRGFKISLRIESRCPDNKPILKRNR